jgi:predicted Fe-Mo cluster-binding NifX family protein
MKIAITANEENLESDIDTRFGRCRFFLIIDTDTMNFESISNEGAMTSGGAGIQAAQKIVNTGGIEAILTGNIGPNAFQIFNSTKIKVFSGLCGSIKETVLKYKKGDLKETKSPNVNSHFGMK